MGPVTVKFKRVETRLCAVRPQFDNNFSVSTLAFQKGLEYRNFHFSVLLSSHFGTLLESL